jgi:hypothetical protein
MSEMTGMPDVPLPDESHGTYTEGWPKQAPVEWGEAVPTWVVPLSDAERLREALEWVARNTYESPTQKKARAALREGEGEELRQLGVPYTDDLDQEGEGG